MIELIHCSSSRDACADYCRDNLQGPVVAVRQLGKPHAIGAASPCSATIRSSLAPYRLAETLPVTTRRHVPTGPYSWAKNEAIVGTMSHQQPILHRLLIGSRNTRAKREVWKLCGNGSALSISETQKRITERLTETGFLDIRNLLHVVLLWEGEERLTA